MESFAFDEHLASVKCDIDHVNCKEFLHLIFVSGYENNSRS